MSILEMAGMALLAGSFARWREPGWELLIGLGNILLGAGFLTGTGHARWTGAANVAGGAFLLWKWWRKGGGQDRVRRALGAKSAALRAALARELRDRTVPVPA